MASTPHMTPHIKYNHTCFFCARGLRFLSNMSSAIVLLAITGRLALPRPRFIGGFALILCVSAQRIRAGLDLQGLTIPYKLSPEHLGSL